MGLSVVQIICVSSVGRFFLVFRIAACRLGRRTAPGTAERWSSGYPRGSWEATRAVWPTARLLVGRLCQHHRAGRDTAAGATVSCVLLYTGTHCLHLQYFWRWKPYVFSWNEIGTMRVLSIDAPCRHETSDIYRALTPLSAVRGRELACRSLPPAVFCRRNKHWSDMTC